MCPGPRRHSVIHVRVIYVRVIYVRVIYVRVIYVRGQVRIVPLARPDRRPGKGSGID
jgi:hypothetical protein